MDEQDSVGSARPSRLQVGQRAETLVADRLVARGYRILGRNVRAGRLELDIVAQKGNLVVVCEVRARTTARWMAPVESIDARKVQRVRLAAAQWLAKAGLRNVDVRFDAASVILDSRGPTIAYYADAF